MATTMKEQELKTRQDTHGDLYHYVESGLTNVYLDGGVKIEESPYGRAVSIVNLDGLHRCIAQCLVEKPGPLSGAEFRFLRHELDLSQRTMALLCGREERTVREWENGDGQEVQEPANTIIRVVYKERYDETATYEGTAKQLIAQLQLLDRQYFEMRLTPTEHGWCSAQEAKAA
jgi:putative transcriptional regulator